VEPPWPPSRLTRSGARQASEDALVVWVGSRLWQGHYGGGWGAAAVLAFVYLGVVISDWVRKNAPSCIGRAVVLSQGSNFVSQEPLCTTPARFMPGTVLTPAL